MMGQAVFGSRRAVTKTVEAGAYDPGQEALRFLAAQGLPPTPTHYALAWEARIERRGLVAMAVDAILMDGRAVMPADVERIMAAPSPADGQDGRTEERRSTLRRQTLKLADLAADAATSSSLFGRDLSHELYHLAGGDASTQRIIEAMIGRTRAVEAELRSASREIDALRDEVEAVRDDARRDALTGLLNRRGVLHDLSARTTRDGGVLAICDVDHFKSVNDRFGHGVGDRVLRGVATALAESCRGHRVARWGGEEFLVILDGVEMAAACVILDQARANLATRTFRLRETDEPLGRITMSVGAVSLRHRSADAAIEIADRRLYAAKRTGRDRLVADEGDGTA